MSGRHPAHLARRGAIYQVRFRLPGDLALTLGVVELRRSLETSDHDEAKIRCAAATAWFRALMDELKSKRSPTRADLERSARAYFARLNASLDELEHVVDGAATDGSIHSVSWIGRPPRYAVEAARWDAASQSGRVSLSPAAWQSRFGFLYTTLRYHYDLNNAEQQTWSRLDGLTGLDRLTPDGKLAIKGDIEQARFYNGSLHQVADIILSRAAAEGLRPTSRHDPAWSICWPITTPTSEGRARMFRSFKDHAEP